MTDEELKKIIDEIKEKVLPRVRVIIKKMRNNFLQSSLKEMKKNTTNPDNLYSDGWWEYIPENEPRHWLTGLYMPPSVDSKVSICKDHPFVQPWMRKEGVFGVVLSIEPPPTITACDENGQVIFGKDGKQVRMPGIPLVEIVFPQEDDYEGGFYLPADCLKVRTDDNKAEVKKEEQKDSASAPQDVTPPIASSSRGSGSDNNGAEEYDEEAEQEEEEAEQD